MVISLNFQELWGQRTSPGEMREVENSPGLLGGGSQKSFPVVSTLISVSWSWVMGSHE